MAIFILSEHSTFAVVDFRNREVPTNVHSIVALMPSISESIIEMGAADKLIGTPEYTNIPLNIKKKIKVIGPFNRLSTETIVLLHPDVVIASLDGNDKRVIEKLEEFKIPVVLIDTHSLKNIVRSHEIIANLIGTPEHIKLRSLQKLVETKSLPTVAPKSVFIQIGWLPLVTVSSQTFIHDIVNMAGGANVFADARAAYPKINFEEVIEKNPEVILICPMSDGDPNIKKSITRWKAFSRIKAVQNKKIFVLKTDLLTKPGFKLIQAKEEIQRLLQ